MRRKDQRVRKRVVLVTGASGEVGHGLITQLAAQPDSLPIVSLDIRALSPGLQPFVWRSIEGDICDTGLLQALGQEYAIDTIFHLAALLSTSAERNPENAHRVNVEGTVNLLKLSVDESLVSGVPVKFIYASSLAVYGMPDLHTKSIAGSIGETDYLNPITMYGCNKLYCELLGRYYADHYQQRATEPAGMVDFRCVRFPGLISAMTLPSGGTSDYAPEMLHAAAQGRPYAAFVREDTRMPFMAMPDAISALRMLSQARAEHLTQRIYNVTGFSRSAAEFAAMVRTAFPGADISFIPSAMRQAIVDSWPCDMDDSLARRDWGWQPAYDATRAFGDYLIPTIVGRYRAPES